MTLGTHDLDDVHERVQIELARRRLIDFTTYTYPSYQAGWFHHEVARELDAFLAAVVAKESPRLLLQAPPRSGKTELVSRRLPAFALGKHPDLSVIATSYAADLSSFNNRDVQRIIDEERYSRVFPATRLWASNVRTLAQGTWMRNSDIFEVVGRRGVYRSAGVMGGITGMGAHILIVDDPIKDDVEANSAVYRERVWNWFVSTAYTRLAPGAGVLIIMTRWHEDDLVGRLIRRMAKGEGEKWRVVRYPALAERDEPNRKAGEALDPGRYSTAEMKAKQIAVGPRVWSSLYQQTPTIEGGGIFKLEWWRYVPFMADASPEAMKKALGVESVVQAWDTGFKVKTANDPSAGMTIGVCKNRYVVLDVWRNRVEYPELKAAVIAQHAKWQPSAVVIEDAASGQSLLQELRRDTRLPLLPFRPDKDKVARANAITPMLASGLVHLVEGAAWVADFLHETSAFPHGAHDDQVDAFSMAMAYVTGGGGGMGVWEWYKRERAKQIVADEQAKEREAAHG